MMDAISKGEEYEGTLKEVNNWDEKFE